MRDRGHFTTGGEKPNHDDQTNTPTRQANNELVPAMLLRAGRLTDE